MGYIDNITKQPLPVYTSASQHAYNKKIYSAQNNLIHNWCSTLRLIPITLTRTESAAVLTHVYLKDVDDVIIKDILTDIVPGELPVFTTSSGIDYICYFGNSNLTASIDTGTYYLHITDGTNNWYTELFCVRDGESYIEFEYSNIFDKWGFVYNGGSIIGFKNRLRLRTRLVDSTEWEEYKEVITDYDLNETVTYSKRTKIYSCSAVVWDYTRDALELMRSHTDISIKYDGNESDILEIKSIEYEKIGNTDYANAVIKFTLRDYIYEPSENLSITAVNNASFYLLLNTGGKILMNNGGKIIKNT